jgi:hypothetical protein
MDLALCSPVSALRSSEFVNNEFSINQGITGGRSDSRVLLTDLIP